MKIFQKFAAASALSLPLIFPALAADMTTPARVPQIDPVACELTTNFGTLSHCLAITGQMSNGVQLVLNQEAIGNRAILDETLASLPRAQRDPINRDLASLNHSADASCGKAKAYSVQFNTLWQFTLDNSYGDHEPGDNFYIVPVTPDVREALRKFINANAECLNTVTDTLGYMMEKNGLLPGDVSQVTSPLYTSIERYRTFDAYRR